MTMAWINIVRKILLFIVECRILVGIHPAKVAAPAIIFFPYIPGRLHCGFAGLMTCRLRPGEEKTSPDQTLADLWKHIQKAALETVLDGTKRAAEYLTGMDALQIMDDAVAALKEENHQAFLFFRPDKTEALSRLVADLACFLKKEEKQLENQAAAIGSSDLEIINSLLLVLKDICWGLERDVLANLEKILILSGAQDVCAVSESAFRKYRKLNLLLNALDRLEVRGRDSAGIQLSFVVNNQETLPDILRQIRQSGWMDEYERRNQKGDLANASIFIASAGEKNPGKTSVTFTYKTYSIVGELGRNVADLRKTIQNDRILQCFAWAAAENETALTHTRWASVGSITEENCHPVNNYSTIDCLAGCPLYPGVDAQISVVLNGDIDNYPALRQALEAEGERIAPQLSTDTKIIPLQIEKYLQEGSSLETAFRLAVNDFEGSHAIAMHSNLEPGKMFLALKGSGQAIFVGIGRDQYMFSSELYGLVEVMPRFIKMNGESGNGQLYVLDQNTAAGPNGITACFYDGRPIALGDRDIQTAEITTRDIDRSDYPHFFLKEISESALSIRRTLRGKYRIDYTDADAPKVHFNLGTDIVPAAVSKGLITGSIKNIVVIGHGTAAVAGQAVADALAYHLADTGLSIGARIASELSGFGLKDDVADTLVIPITQSGTTTDTNRAVAMARERGAKIISIVNRRQSDITAKSHGVFYTSDGRDIEMSVASTKAFYAQIVAGLVLALYFAKLLKAKNDEEIVFALQHLEAAPSLMERIFQSREAVACSVKKTIGKRFWAVVGSGPNKSAADEIRIKLSELCYKTISSDIVENKKHIDLSAEPLILVCAAGNPQAVLEDVVKDVAIFKAHKAAVVVFADEGDTRFDASADAVIPIPQAPHPLPVILNTMAGHLWGYYAARAIDEEAQIFREFRGQLSAELNEKSRKNFSLFDMIADSSVRRVINQFYALFNGFRQEGAFGVLSGKTVADLMLLLKYAAGKLPIQDIRHEFKGTDDFVSPFELLDVTLGTAIDELSRPIDAIRHQAKTVTVGTSRREQELQGVLYDLLGELLFTVKHLTYRNVLSINRIQPAISAIRGYSLYGISGLDEQGNPTDDTTIVIRNKGGIAAGMKSRADHPMALIGTKRMVVSSSHLYTGRGKADGAPLIMIPLLGETNAVANLLLLHIAYNEALPLSEKKEALGYRYHDIRNIITEYNLPWRDEFLDFLSLEALFSEPVEMIAAEIKTRCNQP